MSEVPLPPPQDPPHPPALRGPICRPSPPPSASAPEPPPSAPEPPPSAPEPPEFSPKPSAEPAIEAISNEMPELVLRHPVKVHESYFASPIWPVLVVLLGGIVLMGVLWAGVFDRHASFWNPGSIPNKEVRQQAQKPVTTESKTVETNDHGLGTDVKTEQSAAGKIGQSADGSDWQKLSPEGKKLVCDLALDHVTLKKATGQKLEIHRGQLLEYLDTVYQNPSERQVSIADKIAIYISDMKAEQAKKKAGRVKKKAGGVKKK